MATTDKSEWILLDNDLTTRLAILPVGQSHLYFEINEPGSGELRIPLNTTVATTIESGMFCQCYYRGSSRGGFFIDNIKKTQADAGENGNRWLSVSGRGALALLDDAIIWDNGTTETTREFTSVTKASILITLITEAKARGALANLTYDFSASVDSASVAWTDSESYKLPVGTSLLDVARQFAKTGGFDYEMNLVAGNFVLSAYSAGLGTDKSETIYMRTGINCEEVSTDERGDGINNALRVKYKAGYLTVSDSTSITNRRRREKLLSLEQAQTSASATTYASAKITQTKDPKTSIAVRVYDGISPRLFEDYEMGDYVMTDVLGTEVSYRVLGIQADFDGADYSHVVLELNTLLYDNDMEMSSELDWLMDQWNTANDANELETSFWAALGTRAATGINDMLIYNGYLYICGSGQMAAGGFSGVARYEIATGIWSAMGSGFTDECTALVQMGGDIYVSVAIPSSHDTIYQWNGSAWVAYMYTSGNSERVLQMIDDGASGILYCGSGFSSAGAVYRYVSTSTGVGTDVYCLTYWAGAGTCYTIALYGGKIYAGWYSTSGYTGFMRSKLLSPSVDGCSKEFETITISELNNRYATKLLNYGSDLLVAYADVATGIAYLGQYNGTTFTVLGTFTNAGNNAVINSITTYLTDIYVGGNFDTVDGVADMNRVAKYSGGAWSPLTNGVGAGNVYAAALNDLDLYVAGTFNTVDGTLKPADGLGIYFTNFESALDFASHNTNVNWGDIGGTLADQVDLQAALDAKTSLAFKTIAVSGQSDVVADAKDDTLTLVAGTNITITTNAGADSVTLTSSETATTLGALIGGAADATPNDSDYVATSLTAGGILKKITWTNVKAFLKTYWDTLYAPIAKGVTNGDSHNHSGGDGDPDLRDAIQHSAGMATNKTSPVDADKFLVKDSVTPFELVTVTLLNLKSTLKTYFDTLYAVTAKGVTNGDSHNHDGGDGGTIPAGGISAKAPLVLGGHGNGGTIPASTTYHLTPYISGLDTVGRSSVVPIAGTIKNLYFRLATNQPASGSLVLEVYGGSTGTTATGVKITIAAGSASATYSDTTHTASHAAGDLVTIKIINNATGASGTIGSASFELDTALVN